MDLEGPSIVQCTIRSVSLVAGGHIEISMSCCTSGALLKMAMTIAILEIPIIHIRETCELAGVADKFERTLADLVTYLENEVAAGETREARLTFDGLCFLRDAFTRL